MITTFNIKKLSQAFVIIILGSSLLGCATHGQVKVPVLKAVENESFAGKTFSTEVYYSQPQPGLFSDGEKLPLKPIEEAEVSVGASRVLSRFQELFQRQLPAESSIGKKDNSDFIYIIELTAKDKKGPTFADYDILASTGKSLLTLGLGSSEYTIIADFDILYRLEDKNGKVIYEKSYTIHDEVDHERSKLDGFDIGNDLAAQLLEKHVVISMNDYFKKLSSM